MRVAVCVVVTGEERTYGWRAEEESVDEEDDSVCPVMRPIAPPLNAPVKIASATSTETFSRADFLNFRAYFMLLDMDLHLFAIGWCLTPRLRTS